MTAKLLFLTTVLVLVCTGCKKCPEDREMGEKSPFTDGKYNGY